MNQDVPQKVGGSARRTPTLLSPLERESVPPVYIPTKKAVSWRQARRFAKAITSAHSLIYEQIEERVTYQPHNIIIKSKSKSVADLEKFLPSKAYTDVYAFKNSEMLAAIRLAKQDS